MATALLAAIEKSAARHAGCVRDPIGASVKSLASSGVRLDTARVVTLQTKVIA